MSVNLNEILMQAGKFYQDNLLQPLLLILTLKDIANILSNFHHGS